MTTIQAQIIELIARLPLTERRELVEHLYDVNLFGDSIYDRLSSDQRTRLDASIAQADRGDVTPSETVFNELAKKFGFART